MVSLKDICLWCVGQRVIDLFLNAGRPPWIRNRNGAMQALDTGPIAGGRLEAFVREVLGPVQFRSLLRKGHFLGMTESPRAGRFRLQVVGRREEWSVCLRPFPQQAPTLGELGCHPVMEEWAKSSRGLVLIGGHAASGRSTTCAAFVQAAAPRRLHYRDRTPELLSCASEPQAELLLIPHLRPDQWERAVRQAHRRLVIAVCDGRDAWDLLQPGTCSSDNGHDCLLGVAVQCLVPRADQEGRVLASEVLINEGAVRDLLHRRTLFRIYNEMRNSRRMQTLEESLAGLVQAGLITGPRALEFANDPQELRL